MNCRYLVSFCWGHIKNTATPTTWLNNPSHTFPRNKVYFRLAVPRIYYLVRSLDLLLPHPSYCYEDACYTIEALDNFFLILPLNLGA